MVSNTLVSADTALQKKIYRWIEQAMTTNYTNIVGEIQKTQMCVLLGDGHKIWGLLGSQNVFKLFEFWTNFQRILNEFFCCV